ncbi:MAG: DUF3175 domain-containing protein [Parafilimonas sp.]|nr:DUF3175 domain-containing protein [Parafilimonas sp.]
MAKKAAPKKKAVKKSTAKKSTGKNSSPKKSAKKSAQKKWSKKVTQTSDAMDLEKNVFKQKDPKKIAASVKRSAEKSTRKKAGPFQSAMSMINFYENRGGKNISSGQKKVLDKSKKELRKSFGKKEK